MENTPSRVVQQSEPLFLQLWMPPSKRAISGQLVSKLVQCFYK
jgi:hypothetical protein